MPELVGLAEEILEKGNPTAASDAATAASCAVAGAEGAWFNVLTNLEDIASGERKEAARAQGEGIVEEVRLRGAAVTARFLQLKG